MYDVAPAHVEKFDREKVILSESGWSVWYAKATKVFEHQHHQLELATVLLPKTRRLFNIILVEPLSWDPSNSCVISM